MLNLIASYGFGGRKTLANSLPAEGEPHRPVRVREEAHPADRRPGGLHLHRDRAWARRRRATSSCCRSCSRARPRPSSSSPSFQRVQPEPPHLPRSADGDHRRHPQHDLARACGRRSCSQELKRSNAELEAQAGELEREGEAARAEEHRGRARQPQPRGEGGAAPAHLQVQVRVPREHVARAAHAAQQPAHPLEDAGREQGREPHAGAGEVREHGLHLGQRPARAHQRDPRPLEGRGRQDADRPARHARVETVREYLEQTFRHVAEQKALDVHDRRWPGAADDASSPTSHRLQQILKNLLSNAFKFTEQGRRHRDRGAAQVRPGPARARRR